MTNIPYPPVPNHFLQQNGLSVPRDLYDYVSFVNEPPSAITPAPPGRKSKESKAKAKAKLKSNKASNRGRGRPPSITHSTDGLPIVNSEPYETEVLDTSVDMAESAEQQQEAMNGESVDGDERNDQQEIDDEADEPCGNEQIDVAIETERVLECSMLEDGESTNVAIDKNSDTDFEQSTLSLEGQGSNVLEVTEENPFVELEPVHPLIGLWEGTFNVKAVVGKSSFPLKFLSTRYLCKL